MTAKFQTPTVREASTSIPVLRMVSAGVGTVSYVPSFGRSTADCSLDLTAVLVAPAAAGRSPLRRGRPGRSALPRWSAHPRSCRKGQSTRRRKRSRGCASRRTACSVASADTIRSADAGPGDRSRVLLLASATLQRRGRFGYTSFRREIRRSLEQGRLRWNRSGDPT